MRRGFEKVSGYEYVNFPKRKTKQSAGYDIESAVNKETESHKEYFIDITK